MCESAARSWVARLAEDEKEKGKASGGQVWRSDREDGSLEENGSLKKHTFQLRCLWRFNSLFVDPIKQHGLWSASIDSGSQRKIHSKVTAPKLQSDSLCGAALKMLMLKLEIVFSTSRAGNQSDRQHSGETLRHL